MNKHLSGTMWPENEPCRLYMHVRGIRSLYFVQVVLFSHTHLWLPSTRDFHSCVILCFHFLKICSMCVHIRWAGEGSQWQHKWWSNKFNEAIIFLNPVRTSKRSQRHQKCSIPLFWSQHGVVCSRCFFVFDHPSLEIHTCNVCNCMCNWEVRGIFT